MDIKIPPHLACCYTTLWKMMSLSAKHAINDELQGSVPKDLRYGGVANNQIQKGSLLNVWVIF